MESFQEILHLANDARTRIREVSAEEADAAVNRGAVLLDVREEKEFRAGHLPGSVLLSRQSLATGIADIVPDKATPIVCYCTVGHRSAIAADVLQGLGYLNVSSLAGGLKAYPVPAQELETA